MVDSTLGVLLEADRRDGSQHVHTLRVWLAVDRHLQRTAKLLHVHPNTVRYRLTRIGVLLKLDLRHVDTRFQIDLALRILEALERTTPAGE
jgi:DNA-binding PucR family transcriptional regulator